MDIALSRHAVIVGSDGFITTEFLNHTADAGAAHPWGYQPSQLRLRRGSGNGPVEAIASPTGSGFRFAAEAFAAVVARRDLAAVERAAAGEPGHRRDPRCDHRERADGDHGRRRSPGA